MTGPLTHPEYRRRLNAIIAANKLTIDDLCMALGISSKELRLYMIGSGYLFEREVERIRNQLPTLEAQAGIPKKS